MSDLISRSALLQEFKDDFVEANKKVDHSGYFQNGKDHIGEPNKMIDQFRDGTKKVVTNADRIRAMTDDEWIDFFAYNGFCHNISYCRANGYCRECIKEWLKEKVE